MDRSQAGPPTNGTIPPKAMLLGAREPVSSVAAGRESAIVVCRDGAVYKIAEAFRGRYAYQELPPVPGSAREWELKQAAEGLAAELDDLAIDANRPLVAVAS